MRVALSGDGGRKFGNPSTVSSEHPVGRVGVAITSAGSALVTWLERSADAAEVRVRIIDPKGVMLAPYTLGRVAAGRRSGVPVIARTGDGAMVAWCVAGPRGPRIETALIRPADVTKVR